MSLDPERLRRTLGSDPLAWLVERLRRRLELGRDLTGTVTLGDATTEQRRGAAKLLGRDPRPGKALSIPLDALASRLRAAGIAPDLRTAVETLAGPVISHPETRAAEDAERARLRCLRDASRHSGEQWFDTWSGAIEADGTVTRLMRAGRADTIAHAVAVLDRLPAADLPVPVLAESATGDTKVLANSGLERLVLRAVAAWKQRPVPVDRVDARELWAEVGVIVDDLSSQVLVFNVRISERHRIGRWLDEAAAEVMPFRLTLHQLMRHPSTPDAPEVFVCENPAVMRAAVTELGADCAPLICTEGEAFHACRRFVAAAAAAGARIHWRGDFDWTGVRTTATARSRWNAEPWLMRTRDYLEALELGDTEPLKGRPGSTPWDPELAEAMQAQGAAVMEERLLPRLLEDLRRR